MKKYHLHQFEDLIEYPSQWDEFKILMFYVIQSDGKVDRLERLLLERFTLDVLGLESSSSFSFDLIPFVSDKKARSCALNLSKSLSPFGREVAMFVFFKLAMANHSIDVREKKALKFIAKVWRLTNHLFHKIEAIFSSSANAPYKSLGILPSQSNHQIVKEYKNQVDFCIDRLTETTSVSKQYIQERLNSIEKAFSYIDSLRGGYCNAISL